MGLFGKKKEETNIWENAYRANPQFYATPEGNPFCAFALTEGADTVLPRGPRYSVSGKELTDYRLMLISITKDGMIGDAEYFEALGRLEKYIVDSNEKEILVRGLSLEELEGLIVAQ
ncbi:MAG: hypothetical protein ACSW8G_07840 [Bacillota bacterium]